MQVIIIASMQSFLRKLPAGLFSALVVAAILFLTLVPHPLPDNDIPTFEWFDKVGHFFMFGGLCFAVEFDLWLRWSRRVKGGSAAGAAPGGWRLWLSVAAASIALGGLIEILQMSMELGRTAEWADFIADVLGSLLFSFI